MKYSIIKCVNSNFAIHSETADLNSAKVQFHGLAQTLWNAKDVLTAKIEIVDEQLNCVEGYKEFIHHDVKPEPEPSPEPEPEAETGTETE